MSKLSNVWVFSDNQSRLAEMTAGAAQLGDCVSVFVLGNQADVSTAHRLGATKVFSLGERAADRIVEDYADTMANAIADGEKPTLVLLPATRRGKALAAKLGAKLNAGVFNDASDITIVQGNVQAKHMVYGGLAIGEERIVSPVAVVSVGAGVFPPAVPNDSLAGETIVTPFVMPKTPIICAEVRVKQSERVDLGKARLVVSVGRGIGSKENIHIAESLSKAIGAELGCSRPLAENEKWMEHERYVGISGIMIKPDVYLALGISGQIQHMVGANGAQIIVAVNKDKNAPIFQYADYGIVGDLFKVVPALTKVLKS
ncbi:FAD-binding protein [Budvicia diplopodorum]|uniref:FAD-binding protein n=1 Tax=Budvicia diplopodorum TaxID=1119056 RepID=UPI00135AA32C|nr:FAD-binding protein [Budvicia diplopodorum]